MNLNHTSQPSEPETPAYCRAARTDLKAYLDGETALWQQARVRWHLARCPQCREESVWLQQLGEDMKKLERATPRPELRARILASLPDTPPVRTTRPAPARSSAVPRLAFAGGLAALALVGAFALGRYTGSPAPTEKHTVIARQQPTPSKTETQTAQNSGTKSVIPELPRPTIAPDPTTQMAETLVRQQEQAETRQEAERKRNEERLAKLVSQSQTGKAGQPVEIALTVRNTSWTRDRLRDWAERAGGKLDEMPVARAISDKATTPATETKKSIDPNLVALRVPVDRAPALLKVMQGMEDTRQQANSGKVSRMPLKLARAAVSADSRSQNGSIPLSAHPRKEVDEIKTERLDGPRTTERVFTETPGKPYVTLFVRFRSAPIK